jgi:HAD superfamily hydrolase (TIGR01509 family)
VIRAMIFDLDGTLVQTERLKAISYARAAIELCPHDLTEDEVIEAFKDVVGLSRQEVATALVERFSLEKKARALMAEFDVGTPWQAYVQVRLRIYDEMLADPEILRANRWPHNIALLEEARRTHCEVGLATMSRRKQATRVLDVLDLSDAFAFVATRDDVERPKPDPEIYLLVSRELKVPPSECLVIEDSPTGVKAAQAAEMAVVAVSTPFTQQHLHEGGLLPPEHIVDNPDTLPSVVAHIVAHHNADR